MPINLPIENAAGSGKELRLRKVSNERGVIAALAIDQRAALQKLIGGVSGTGPDSVPPAMLSEFKKLVTEVLSPLASAVLLDPEYGQTAARHRAPGSGLLLAYEQTGYDRNTPGRLPRLLDRWSVQRLARLDPDSIKVLVYYSPSSNPEINDRKHAFVERIGAECSAEELPFFLELVVYEEGLDEKSPDFAKLKPDLVSLSAAEFSKPQYRVDILKVGMPVNMNYVEGAPGAAGTWIHSREQAKKQFRRASDATGVPFIYLSEGIGNEAFVHALELASEAGSRFSGVLCGRATWKDGVPVYVQKGSAALEQWLRTEGARNIERVNSALGAAVPWFALREGTS
jgi:tagatose 1,6-diphosphate aldolase